MNSDEMLFWMEEDWMNEPLRVTETATEPKGDIEDAAPWNKGRVN